LIVLPRAKKDLASIGFHRLANDVRDGAQCIVGPRRVQGLSAERCESVDFRSAGIRQLRLTTLALEQLRPDNAGYEKRKQDQPVERIFDGECAIRREEAEIEDQECCRGERDTEQTSARRAASQHDEEERQRNVRLVESRADEQQERRRGEQQNKPDEPESPL